MNKKVLNNTILKFGNGDLFESAVELFSIMDYPVNKTLEFRNVSFSDFQSEFGDVFVQKKVCNEKLLKNDWISANLLFQLSEAEIEHIKEFKAISADDNCVMESYLFWAVELSGEKYTKTSIANFTREFNKVFNIPCFILFKYNENITFALIDRRTNKREIDKDVLEKVTLIKDISILNPHRGHIEILSELEFSQLKGKNFAELHEEWKKKLNIDLLSKKFYSDISNWYYWASGEVYFPGAPIHTRFLQNPREDMEVRAHNSKNLIRLLTRVLFVWFIKEKGLIPEEIFEEEYIDQLIFEFDPEGIEIISNPTEGSRYYKAILQNLFFATLNQVKDKREFRKDNTHHNKTNLMRYKRFFKNPDDFLELMEQRVPFMNGGLFECLDILDPYNKTTSGYDLIIREDGFSDSDNNDLEIPDYIFFGKREHIDLSNQIGKDGKNIKVLGLIEILKSYKFTISENTPVEEDIALDPELLGKVFENLLASYNPETQTTARKQTGSFYTPRPIVDYMVDESLKAHLKQATKENIKLNDEELDEALGILFSYTEKEHIFTDYETELLITALNSCKILDPACGSGAFPMGVLQKMVYVLHKLDPKNEIWKKKQLDNANYIDDPNLRERAIESINEAFESNELDYGRKLYLIENCIYGVDIQPIATQISKLRFFISLMVDQKVDWTKDNFGVLALPNLESNFVTANTLINIEKPHGWEKIFTNQELVRLEMERKKVRDSLFSIKSTKRKQELRDSRKIIEKEMSEVLLKNGFDSNTAKKLIQWNPYEQNESSLFFDPEWMFGVTDGFSIVIGNPPYVRADSSELHLNMRKLIESTNQYETLWEKWDLYIPFIEKGYKLLDNSGVVSLIVSDAFCHAKYAKKSQEWFLNNSKIIQLDFLSDISIFEAAVSNVIFFFQKSDYHENIPKRYVHKKMFGNKVELSSDLQTNLTYRTFFPEDNLCVEYGREMLPLNEICYISYGLRPNSKENDSKGEFKTADLISEIQDEIHCKPYVEGKHLTSWIPNRNIWIEWGTDRAPKRFCRPTFKELYEVDEKIIAPRSPGLNPFACYDNEKLVYTPASVGFIPWDKLSGVRNNSLKKTARYQDESGKAELLLRECVEENSKKYSIKFLLGVMNSSVVKNYLISNRRSNIHIYPEDWKTVPIPVATNVEQSEIESLVDKIISTKQTSRDSDISSLEKEVDRLVCLLYAVSEK